MSLKNRQTLQYLIAVALLVPVIIALYFVARVTQNQDIGVFTRSHVGGPEIVVMKRDGSYERFWKNSTEKSVRVERGKWTLAMNDPNQKTPPTGVKPGRMLNFTSEEGKTMSLSKAEFEKPTPETSRQVEEARRAAELP
jgi:hypothetical protein